MPIVAAVVAVAGAATKAIGDNQRAQTQASADEFNASVKGQQAQEALQEGAEKERINRVQSASFIGQQRANYGASGVSGGSGSAMDVLQASAQNAEMDALNVRHQAQMKAWSLQTGAQLDTANASNARSAGAWSVAGDVLGGAAQVGGMINRYGGSSGDDEDEGD